MDIVTHGLLGALAAQSISAQRNLRAASLVGGVAALLPDVDVFIRSTDDVLMALTYHRHFTHSLFFVPMGALLTSLLLWPFLRHHLSNLSLYRFAFVGYLSACLLDVCTSYGTHLFWPFSDSPVALSIIAVVDPVFSLILLMTGFIAWYSRKRHIAWIGVLLAGSYLLIALLQYQKAATAAGNLALERGLTPERIVIKPTLGNLLLWRSLQVDEGIVFADAIRVSPLASPKIYPGESIALVDPTTWGNLPKSSRAYQDLQRYHELADQLLVVHPQQPHFIGDLRYAMLPHSTTAMWGITLNPEAPNIPAGFIVNRQLSPEERDDLLDMLKGQ
jgi:inner membrane protein